jgi:hypothetical protein
LVAHARGPSGGRRSRVKSFKCPNCRDYDVSRSVLERRLLRKLDPAQRRDVLERTRKGAAPNTRPVITSYIL